MGSPGELQYFADRRSLGGMQMRCLEFVETSFSNTGW
jgi:hypothetical protein